MAKEKTTVAEAAAKDWLTKKQFADELGVTLGNLNQILMRGPAEKKFPKPGPTYCQKIGKQNRYSPEYINLVAATRESKGRSKRTSRFALKKAALVIPVPVFDQGQADYLLKKFKNVEAIDGYLREKLSELYKPVMNRLAEIEEEFLRKKREILESTL